jgi:hypothetical protein
MATGQKLAEEDIQESAVQTAEDFVEKSNKEFMEFEQFRVSNPVTAITDKRSQQRFLDRNVILVCKQKVGQEFVWRLPEQKLQENETLRQVIEFRYRLIIVIGIDYD